MKVNPRFILFTLGLILVTTLCKFYFGSDLTWSGFSPVIAIALFAGFIMQKRDNSFLLPLLAVFLSDVAIQLLYKQGKFDYPGFYSGQWKNYLFILAATFIGIFLKGRKYSSLLIASVAAPTAYFLLSNLSVWLGTTEAVYPKSFSGLMSCYAAGLPFYKNGLLATLVFLPAILLSYNYFVQRKTSLVLA